MEASPDVSVVLASRNRAPQLRRLLLGLQQQRDAPKFEVIVADNGSQDETATVIAGLQDRLDLRSVFVSRPGKSVALNAALRLARGAIIVFTDDDVFPDANWLANMAAAIAERPDCNVFGGRIDVDLDSVPDWVRRSFNLMALLTGLHDRPNRELRYGRAEYPFGPNMAIRRSLIAGVAAPYPEHLGPGTRFPVGDESAFLMAFSPPEARDRLFVPSARVVHQVEADSTDFLGALRRCCDAGIVSGRLGMPAEGPSSEGQKKVGTLGLILLRIRSSHSVREFACITVRYFGYLWGRRLGPFPTAQPLT